MAECAPTSTRPSCPDAFPAGISEFDAVGLEREASLRVKPPRVAASPAAIDASVLEDGHPQIDRLQPLSRLGRDEWGTAGQVRTITRIRHSDWPGHFSAPDFPRES